MRGGATRWRRRLIGATALVLLAGIALALHVGWLRRSRPWREATGYDRIPAPPAPVSRVEVAPDEPPVELHWLGHAGFLLQWHGVRLLLDPDASSHCTVSPRLLEPCLPPSAWGPVDAALVSHGHFDHLDLPTLEGIPQLRRVVVPKGSEAYVEALGRGATQIVGLSPGDALALGPLEIVALPARHHGNRLHPFQSARLAVSYLVRHGASALFFSGDTAYGPHFQAIGRAYHPSVAILSIGAFRPSFPLRAYHLAPEEAVLAARDLGARTVVPCHFGTFVLSLDREDEPLPRFAAAARAAGLNWIMPALWTERAAPEGAR